MTTITLRQAQKLLAFFGGHDCEVTILSERHMKGATLPGLYAFCTEYPEEGCEYLGPTEVDDELAAQGSAPCRKDECTEPWTCSGVPCKAAKERVLLNDEIAKHVYGVGVSGG